MNDVRCDAGEVDETGHHCAEIPNMSENCFGGLYRMYKIINKARQDFKKGKGPPVLVLHAGNSLIEEAYCNKEDISDLVNAYNFIKINAMVST